MAWVDNFEMVIADIPGLIEGAHEGTGLGDRFLKHVERCAAFLHIVDATVEDVVNEYHVIRRELELYDGILMKKPEVIALNKCDSLLSEEVEKKVKAMEKAVGHKVYAMSAIAKQGIFDCLLDLNQYITRDRLQKNKQEVEEQEDGALKTWSPV